MNVLFVHDGYYFTNLINNKKINEIYNTFLVFVIPNLKVVVLT